MSNACRQIELGRSGYLPESMVKWEGSPIPAPYMYYRTSSMVAYAELCAPEDLFDTFWSEVVSCAIAAGATVGVSVIVADPEAARPQFEGVFRSGMAKIGERANEILVSLSARQQPNKEWHR